MTGLTARDEFAVIITALSAGRIDGPQALAACVAQAEKQVAAARAETALCRLLPRPMRRCAGPTSSTCSWRLPERDRQAAGPYVGGPGLTDPQRALLLTPCGCGHTLEDHGSLTPCWRCEENGAACARDFESLLVERIGWLNRTEATS